MNIVQAVKKCAMDAFDASLPSDVVFGKVKCVEPLTVQVGEMTLDEDILSVCQSLLYKEQLIEFSIYERVVVINEGLKEGDTLVMLRKGGGESYVAVGKL